MPFYIAVGDYMEASMGRLQAQDIKMGDMIREKVHTVDDRVAEALAALHDRLTGLQERVDGMLAARDKLEPDSAAGLGEFENAARDLTDYIVANLGHQEGGATGLAGELFSTKDWEYMAGITDEDLAREMALFEKVNATTPPDLVLPNE